MQLGFVGLGKMGGNMVHRIHRDSDHQVVAFDFNEEAVQTAEGHGATGASSLEDLVSKLDAPRHVWIMVPAGDPTQQTVDQLAELLDEGDTIIDGGNSKWTDDKLRAEQLSGRGIDYIDVGTSGGVWGKERGYCLMIGGDGEPVRRLEPVFVSLAPEKGWHHVGASGSGHFVKMVHNGIEYGLMQAYAEGFELMHHSEFELDLKEIAGIWRYGSVVRSWLLELLHEALIEHGSTLDDIAPYVEDSGEGRWTINEAINAAVPVPVMASSLFARFASRREIDFAAKVAAALRNQFGGHAVRAIEKAMDRPHDPRA